MHFFCESTYRSTYVIFLRTYRSTYVNHTSYSLISIVRHKLSNQIEIIYICLAKQKLSILQANVLGL
jgi:hypothetical protein